MKRGTTEHPKMLDFAEAIEVYLAEQGVTLPYDVCHTLACGIIVKLFSYTARYAAQGDVGKHTDARIARALGWIWDAEWLVRTLLVTKWLDAEPHRLYVHDWHEHADDTCDRYLADNELRYANGSKPRNKPRRNSKAARGTHAERGTTPAPDRETPAERGLTSIRTSIRTSNKDGADDDARVPPVTDAAPTVKRFKPPTVEEVRAYCVERKNSIDPEYFVDSYVAKGWLINKSPMKDWKATVRTWEKNGSPSGRVTKSESPPPSAPKEIPDRVAPVNFKRDPYAENAP